MWCIGKCIPNTKTIAIPCIKLKRLGDMIDGHRKRRNIEALIKFSATFSLSRSQQQDLKLVKTSLNSLQLKKKHQLIREYNQVFFFLITNTSFIKHL